MKIKGLFVAILLLAIALPQMAGAQTERKYIRQGNRQFNSAFADSTRVDSARFADAEASYRKALEEDPNSWDASFNLANAMASQGRMEEAARQYQALGAKTDVDKTKRAAAYHNLGNCLLQSENLQGAIDAYKNALRNNPNDLETKYNLAWAQDKMKQQQNENQQNQNQNKQDQQQNQDQKQNQDQQQDQQQNQDQQQKDKQDQQSQDNQQQQQQAQQQPEQNDEQMSKEDAMRILEALENDEKDVQEKVQKQKAQPQRRRTQKDW
ncbi:MAG: tetratricopeptide repeat protein [Salinivirgaceae bacterium]|nr:tetratricopeptide repeat protein [Salinivirgaceae bacterium]